MQASEFFLEKVQIGYLNAILDKISKVLRKMNKFFNLLLSLALRFYLIFGIYPIIIYTMIQYLELLYLISFTGILAVAYSYLLSGQIISSSPGNSRMQEIAEAIQIGAKAYLARQYKTIAIVGVLVLAIVTYFFNYLVGLGYFIGAFLSGVAGYVGMLISVKANVRTAEASRKSLQSGLTIAFKSGAITGLLVAGLALLAITFTILF